MNPSSKPSISQRPHEWPSSPALCTTVGRLLPLAVGRSHRLVQLHEPNGLHGVSRGLLTTIPAFLTTSLSVAIVATAVVSFAVEAELTEQTDWPATIAQLRHEMQQNPGAAIIQQQLAIAYNNYGVSLAGQGEWGLAKRQLEEAVDLDPDEASFKTNLATICLNEAHDLYLNRRSAEAKLALERTITLAPELVQAYVLLGTIEYESQHLRQAKAAWEQALLLDPALEQVSQRLDQLKRELPIEAEFGRISQAYFDLRFEDVLERPRGFDLSSVLLEARREVGSDFAYWPSYKIVVLLYSAESFRALRRETPEWVSGQFDGKIRVPLPGDQFDVATVKQILFHEYTHALIHDLSKNRCPTWFSEGLAEYEGRREGPTGFQLLKAAFAEDRLMPWDTLDQAFAFHLPHETVALGYEQAHSIIQYLVERYGFWRLRRLLKAAGSGQPFANLLTQELHMKPDRLERAWRTWLPQFLGRTS